MGGVPVTALNIVAFPSKLLPLEILAEILRGGADKATEAGVSIVGGHTIEDDIPKYGLAVTGTVHPARAIANSTGQAGDRLILTKPIGVGILTTALKSGVLSETLTKQVIRSMTTLNKAAGEVLARRGAHAATDITGFGLLGHLREMAVGSGLGAEISYSAVPLLPEVLRLAAADEVPGGTHRNLAHVAPFVHFDARLSQAQHLILADAQTSGGLLIAVAPSDTAAFRADLAENGVTAWDIGHLSAEGGIRVSL
jgi:selenide,water dikinase